MTGAAIYLVERGPLQGSCMLNGRAQAGRRSGLAGPPEDGLTQIVSSYNSISIAV